jgi:hypothetical protein
LQIVELLLPTADQRIAGIAADRGGGHGPDGAPSR